MDKKVYKHDKKEDVEVLKLNKNLKEVREEASKQKSIVTGKPSLKTMASDKMHVYTDDTGAAKAQIKINGKLYEFTLTEV